MTDLRRELLRVIIPTQNEAGQVRAIDAADAILSSAWLEQVRAQAWLQGRDAQVSVGGNQFVRRAQNPYDG